MDSRVAGRADKIEARVDAEVDLLTTLRLLLLPHVHLVLVVDKLDDGSPAATDRSSAEVRSTRSSHGLSSYLSRLLT